MKEIYKNLLGKNAQLGGNILEVKDVSHTFVSRLRTNVFRKFEKTVIQKKLLIKLSGFLFCTKLERTWEMKISEAAIIAVVSSVVTFLGNKIKVQYDLKQKEVEADSNTEGIYIQHMNVILSEYKDQVSAFRSELKAVQDELDEFKRQHHTKMNEYQNYIELLETENKDLRENYADLREENADLKEELKTLKGSI